MRRSECPRDDPFRANHDASAEKAVKAERLALNPAWVALVEILARIEHDKALARVMTAVLKDDTELFKQFMDNDSFKRWLTDTVFRLTYESQPGASPR